VWVRGKEFDSTHASQEREGEREGGRGGGRGGGEERTLTTSMSPHRAA